MSDVFLGSFTQTGRLDQASDEPAEFADGTVPVPAVDRLAYAVRVTGLELYPMGGPSSADRAHDELIVFVDARTGAEIMTTTFR